MKPYLPFYATPPCKVLRYEDFERCDRAGNCYTETVVYYLDKKGKPQEATSRVKWTHVDEVIRKKFYDDIEEDMKRPQVIYVNHGFLMETTMEDMAKLTDQERTILSNLGDSWNMFLKLENKSDDDINDFRKSIHDAQRIIAQRVARRTNPDILRMPNGD